MWYDQIRVNFIYPRAELFATPPTATEGVRFLNPRPCWAITHAAEELIMLYSDEFIASSNQRLTSFRNACAGALHDLGVDSDGQKTKKEPKKKSVSTAGGSKTKN
ncbi:hypothetical protein Hanom_Chr07g00627201 [Helianthus anomalus]